MNILLIFGVLLVIGAILYYLFEILPAPEGWEDDDGFHLGKKP